MGRRYDVIYADPPWNVRGGGRIKRGSDRHYDLMRTEDIAAIPVADLAKDDCHLYLWVTNNFMPDGLGVMDAWGFRYVTMVTWPKPNMGLGQYFRGKTEHVLFGVRGMIPYKLDAGGKRCQGTTLLPMEGFREHSRKPESMRKAIERVSLRPGMRALELFARRTVPRWDVWGDEVGGFVEGGPF